MGKVEQTPGRYDEVHTFIAEVYGRDLHAKRIASLAGATLGVMAAASLAVAMIGHALAQARGLVTVPPAVDGTPSRSLRSQGCG